MLAAPLMSTVDLSQHMRGHSHSHSQQRSSQRLSRPFALPRIPSERLDPRSVHFDHTSKSHDTGQRSGEHGLVNRTSSGANGSISAPSIFEYGQLMSISKRGEGTTRTPEACATSRSQSYNVPRVDGKTEISAIKMDSKLRWATRNPQDWLQYSNNSSGLTALSELSLQASSCPFHTSSWPISPRATPSHSSPLRISFLGTCQSPSFSITFLSA